MLADEIFEIMAAETDIDLELVVVDDNSPDGTGQIAEGLVQKYPVQVVHRSGKLGLGSAVMEGFSLSTRPFLGAIDADLSHDPAILPRLIRELKEYDITIGSRFGPGSYVEEWALHRKLVSFAGVGAARLLTGVEDPLSGYFFLHRSVIDGLCLTSAGYKILLEILIKGHYRNHLSVPFVFRSRQSSRSKLNRQEYFLFLKQLLYFSWVKLSKSGVEGSQGKN